MAISNGGGGGLTGLHQHVLPLCRSGDIKNNKIHNRRYCAGTEYNSIHFVFVL